MTESQSHSEGNRRRAGDADGGMLAALLRYDTPTLSNAVETLSPRPFTEGYTGSQIRCAFPGLPRVTGFAVTAKITGRARPASGAAGQTSLYEFVLTQPAPRLVVIEDVDAPDCCGCFWGEVHATIFRELGCVATVTNGLIRDLPEIERLGFQCFSGGIGVSHAYVEVIEIGCDVQVGGLTVAPGDVMHGDAHGVLAIPTDLIDELPSAADAVTAGERELIDWVHSPGFSARELADRLRH